MKRKINERKYMQMAIDEMMESRSEHTKKSDPMVGAVLVDKNGKILGKTHRGSLRVGDHAEYTLIEKILRDRSLEGSTLYVTLEPCTIRNNSKIPCAVRIVSARIEKVFIGIPDPNPDIGGKGYWFLTRNGVKVDFFNSDLVEQIIKENEEFINQFEDKKKNQSSSNKKFEGPSETELEPIKSTTINDFSIEEIKKYLKYCGKSIRVPSPNLWKFFYQSSFVVPDNSKNKYIPTIAGLLLFGKEPEIPLTQSIIKIDVKIGDRNTYFDLKGPLISILDKIENIFKKYVGKFTRISGFKREELFDFPLEALREAVINAIAHRDYKEGAKINIFISSDKIIIRSPGHPPSPLTIKDIQNYRAPPYSRNPKIANALNNMNLMEERGTGIPRIRDLLNEYGLKPPIFSIDGGYFVVTFLGYKKEPGKVEIAHDLLSELNPRQKDVIKLLSKQRKITSSEYIKKYKISNYTAVKDLNKLIELGIIIKRGIGRSTYYALFKS